MIWTLDDIMAATGGSYDGPTQGRMTFNGIDFDSRRIKDGDIFLAFSGTKSDGHDYLDAAKTGGAGVALVSRKINADIPQIIVPNVQDALWNLAKASRSRSHAKVTAITGSVGKTGTRALVAACLETMGRTHATTGNFNNHIGAPLSLARMPEQTDYGVFELGMDHAGEIASLSPLVKPDIAIITRIAASHIGYFDSIEGIAHAKAEIFDGLNDGGIAILNADDKFTPMLATIAKQNGASRVITVGSAKDADVHIETATITPKGFDVTFGIDGKNIRFMLGMAGAHWVNSAVMALTVVHHFGGNIKDAADALADHQELDGRGARTSLTLNMTPFTLIDDSYNASPASMAAGINTLAATPMTHNGRKIAILADMLELGDDAPSYHRDMAAPLIDNGIDIVICFGPMMAHLADALRERKDHHINCYHCDDADAATQHLMAHLRSHDVVLVKGSNGMKAHKITHFLKTRGQDGHGQHNGDPHAA